MNPVSIRAEVDPLTVAREARDKIVGRMRRDGVKSATIGWDSVDVELPFKVGLKCNQVAAWRPSRCVRDAGRAKGEADRVRAVGFRHPDFPISSASRLESQ